MCYRSDSGELGLRTRNLFRGLAGIDGGPIDGFLRALGIGLGRLRGVGAGGQGFEHPPRIRARAEGATKISASADYQSVRLAIQRLRVRFQLRSSQFSLS